MSIRFTKMHGAGNDYIYLDCFRDPVPTGLPELARAISHRRFGAGADGLILIHPSDRADARMQMFNADGSESNMCGNGLRCVAKYIYDHDLAKRTSLTIETGGGLFHAELSVSGGLAQKVRIDMGAPIFEPASIPTTLPGTPPINVSIEVGGRTFEVTSLSMGNPHCVVYVDKATDDWVLGIGQELEVHPMFPAKANVEFVEVLGRGEVKQRTWERGSGETWACGSGAAAVCVAGVLSGRTERRILNHLVGGDLELFWNPEDNHVYKTGEAVEVFSGEWK